MTGAKRDHDEIAELLGAYALHAVDADERALVEAHLETCPKCRAEVQGHVAVATRLGNSGGQAPDGLWDRIASTLEEVAPPMRLHLPEGRGRVVPITAASGSTRARRRLPRSFLGAAAAAAVVIGLLGLQVVRQDDRLSKMQTAMENTSLVKAANLALADPAGARVELSSDDGSVKAPAVVLPDGTGYLLAHEMPELAPDRTYQLWGQTDAGLVSLGLLGSDPNEVVAFQAGSGVQLLAVTDEVSAGVVQSANAPVVVGDLG